jgi:hypothetical protein
MLEPIIMKLFITTNILTEKSEKGRDIFFDKSIKGQEKIQGKNGKRRPRQRDEEINPVGREF